MGWVERKLRSANNQAFAEDRVVVTSLSVERAVEAVAGAVARLNEGLRAEQDAERQRLEQGGRLARWAARNQPEPDLYHVVPSGSDELWIGYGVDLPALIEGKFKLGAYVKFWIAVVEVAPGGSQVSTDPTQVAIRLEKWVVNDDGRIQFADQYETLRAAVLDALPSGTDGDMA